MKKLFGALTLCLALCLAAAGCAKPDDNSVISNAANDSLRMQIQPLVYSCDELDIPLGELAEQFSEAVVTTDRIWAIGYTKTDAGNMPQLLTAMLDGSGAQTVAVPQQQVDISTAWSNLCAIAAAPGGNVCVIEQLTYADGRGQNYYIHYLSADGSYAGTVPVNAPVDYWMETYHIAYTDDGTLYTPGGSSLTAISSQGELRDIPVGNDNCTVDRVTSLSGGELLVTWGIGQEFGRIYTTARFQPATGETSDELLIPESLASKSFLASPNGDLFLADGYGIYAYDKATGAADMICSWLDSDIDYTTTVSKLAPRADGSFIAVGYGHRHDQLRVSELKYVDPATLPQKTTLTLACNFGWEMQQAVLEFNRKSDTTRIVIKQYDDYSVVQNQDAVAKMDTDIVTGNIPDILLVDQGLPFHSYVNKGMFTDLYPLMDADSSPVHREDILPSILTAFETDGKLTSLPDSFCLTTAAADSGLVGGQTDWTWQAFFDLLQSHPEIKSGFDSTYFRQYLLQQILLLGGDQFINYEDGACHFDDPMFQRLLEYTADYEDEHDEDYYAEYIDPKDLYSSRQCLLYLTTLYNFEYGVRENSYIFNGNQVYVGMPTLNGAGGSALTLTGNRFAISETCPDKAAAWAFVSTFFASEWQQTVSALPVNTAVLQARVAQSMDPETHPGTWDDIAMRPTTQGEADQVLALIDNTTALLYMDEYLMNIIMEEVEAFYAGAKSAADTAAIIQNRVSTYLAEGQ